MKPTPSAGSAKTTANAPTARGNHRRPASDPSASAIRRAQGFEDVPISILIESSLFNATSNPRHRDGVPGSDNLRMTFVMVAGGPSVFHGPVGNSGPIGSSSRAARIGPPGGLSGSDA